METNFSNTPRIKNKAFLKRVGDNLLERDNGGHVCCSIGYYFPSQVLARKLFSQKIINRIMTLRLVNL